MADFINTIDLLGDDVVVKSIIERKITEFNDDVLQKIGDHSFQNSQKLVSVNLPNVTFVGDYGFYGCKALTSVNLPLWNLSDSMYVFQGCSSLPSIDLPSLMEIGMFMFSHCTVLKTVILRKESVCSLFNSDVFFKTPFASSGTGGILLVPRSLVESYKTAKSWSAIWGYGHNRFLAIEDYTVDGTITGEIDWDKLNGGAA